MVRFIPTNVHGVIDYVVGVVLIAAPWLFGFYAGGAESVVPLVLGAVVILYSLFTDYEAGMVRTIPVPVHLALDGVVGLVLLLSPWLFGFAALVLYPHLVVGMLVIVAALTTKTEPESGTTPPTAQETQRRAHPQGSERSR